MPQGRGHKDTLYIHIYIYIGEGNKDTHKYISRRGTQGHPRGGAQGLLAPGTISLKSITFCAAKKALTLLSAK